MLLRPDGSTLGTVGGGAIEQEVLEALAALPRRAASRSCSCRELGYDLGMCCGGRMEIFIEPIEARAAPDRVRRRPRRAAPAPLCAHASASSVTVVDEREELNSAARFPEAARVLLRPERRACGARRSARATGC